MVRIRYLVCGSILVGTLLWPSDAGYNAQGLDDRLIEMYISSKMLRENQAMLEELAVSVGRLQDGTTTCEQNLKRTAEELFKEKDYRPTPGTDKTPDMKHEEPMQIQ